MIKNILSLLIVTVVLSFLSTGCSGGGYVPGAYEELVYLSTIADELEAFEMDDEYDAVSGKVVYYSFDMAGFDQAFFEAAKQTAKVKQIRHSLKIIPKIEGLIRFWNMLPEDLRHTLTMPDINETAKNTGEAATVRDMIYSTIDKHYYDLEYDDLFILNALHFIFDSMPTLESDLKNVEAELSALVVPTPEYAEDQYIYSSLKFQIDSTLLAIDELQAEVPQIFSSIEPTITALEQGGKKQQEVVMQPERKTDINTEQRKETHVPNKTHTQQTNKEQLDLSKPELQNMVREIVREELSKHTFTATDTSDQIMGIDVYNRSGEKQLKLRYPVFTDGNLYCIQVSSWQTEKKAFEEANRLIAGGLNAFVVKEYVEEKSSYWFRVRVGYFDTLDKAKQFMSKFL